MYTVSQVIHGVGMYDPEEWCLVLTECGRYAYCKEEIAKGDQFRIYSKQVKGMLNHYVAFGSIVKPVVEEPTRLVTGGHILGGIQYMTKDEYDFQMYVTGAKD